MEKKDLEMLDERFVKKIEYVKTITEIRKDVNMIKWFLGIIAVGTLSPVIESLLKLIIK